jgi:hypothetical protein
VAPFDPVALPYTAAFFGGLPNGLDSYPHCRVRSIVSREIVQEFPFVMEHAGADAQIMKRLRESMDQGEWMPDAQGMVLRLLVRDLAFKSDADYHRWYYEISGRLFAKPFYRFLMYVVSPTLVLLGATKRWAAFREGSVMNATVSGNQGQAELRFPDGLYPVVTLGGFGETIRAALVAARARNARVDLVEATPTLGRWKLAWQ